MRPGKRYPTLEDALYSRIVPHGDCELWQGPVGDKGYGRFMYRGVRYYAHRLVLTLATEPHPSTVYACHTCDTPLCCKVEHLFWGTPGENFSDMQQKGRGFHARGEEHARAVDVDPEQVRALAASHSWKELAIRFGISKRTVGRIIHKEGRWRLDTRPSACHALIPTYPSADHSA